MVSNQFRINVGRVGAIISIVAIIMWLALIPNIMEVGTALNALGNALILIALIQVRRRYSPTARARRR